VSPVRYELDFISQKTPFFIVTAVKTSNLTQFDSPCISTFPSTFMDVMLLEQRTFHGCKYLIMSEKSLLILCKSNFEKKKLVYLSQGLYIVARVMF
jgi:hypothetical protein